MKKVFSLPNIIAVTGLVCVFFTFIYAHDRAVFDRIKNDPTTMAAFANKGYYTIVNSSMCKVERYIMFGFDIPEEPKVQTAIETY